MASTFKVRFANAKKEYIKTLVPLAVSANFAEAMYKEADPANVDYTWIKNEVLNTIESFFLSDGIQTICLWVFDEFDRDFLNINVIYNPAGQLIGRETWDPTAKITAELRSVGHMISDNLRSELPDIYMRCTSASININQAINSMANAVNATPASATDNKAELDELCKRITENTKAEIVKPTETLADYVCNDILKEELEEIKNFFEHSMDYKNANIIIPKGILLKGPYGTGKTYAARCIAGSVDCYFMTCTASALQGQYIGSGAENIRAVFKSAKMLAEKSNKGVILFIDEIDSFGDRQSRSGGASGEEDRTLNQLLAEMSGFTESENIMVLAATNFPERLDGALLRSGRFGRQITIDYPDEYERCELVKYYFGKIKLPLETSITYDDITALTKGLTPADIKEIANESGILAIRLHKTTLDIVDINEAVNKVITKNIRHPDKSQKELDLVTAHECGHVLAEVRYERSIPIKVTNYAYGDAGGFTQPAKILSGILPKDDFIAKVKTLLGGRAAEQVMCGYITNGASNDLKKAKDLMYNYFKIYNFEPYEVEKLDQRVLDKINELFNEVVADFSLPGNKTKLENLVKELSVKRVLYSADIANITNARKVVF